jgi:hypothetical protein
MASDLLPTYVQKSVGTVLEAGVKAYLVHPVGRDVLPGAGKWVYIVFVSEMVQQGPCSNKHCALIMSPGLSRPKNCHKICAMAGENKCHRA